MLWSVGCVLRGVFGRGWGAAVLLHGKRIVLMAAVQLPECNGQWVKSCPRCSGIKVFPYGAVKWPLLSQRYREWLRKSVLFGGSEIQVFPFGAVKQPLVSQRNLGNGFGNQFCLEAGNWREQHGDGFSCSMAHLRI